MAVGVGLCRVPRAGRVVLVKGHLEHSDLDFHEREYERLRADLEQAFQDSRLRQTPISAAALNDLLVRVRLRC